MCVSTVLLLVLLIVYAFVSLFFSFFSAIYFIHQGFFFSCTLVNLNYLSIGWEGETGVYDMVWVWKYFVPMVMCVKLF